MIFFTVIKDEDPSVEEIPDFFYPIAKAQVSEGSTFAVVSRLACHEFSVSNKGCTWTHPDFQKLNVVVPEGAVSLHDDLNVVVKVIKVTGSKSWRKDMNSQMEWLGCVIQDFQSQNFYQTK